MIEAPGIELLAEPAPNWSFAGPLADRVQDTLRHIQEQLDTTTQWIGLIVAPARLQVVICASGSCRPGSRNPAQPGRCPDRPETGR